MYSNYDQTIVVRIPNSIYLKLKNECLPCETLSDVVRRAINNYLSNSNSNL